MPQRKIGRREFLKLAIAAAGAAGLSHFRILNIGGADVAYARECEVGSGENPDVCTSAPPPGSVDWCIPLPDGDPDLCSPDPGLQPSDMCPDSSPGGDGDRCQPDQGEPDACVPWATTFANPDTTCVRESTYDDPDVCYSSPQWIDPDVCDPTSTPPEPDACGSEIPDTCGGGDPDECEDGQEGDTCTSATDPDICPDGAGGDDDECLPAQSDQDICPEPFGGAGDTCQPPADPDVCSPGYTPDECIPPDDPDDPNPVTVGSVGVESASSILPSLGGVAAALGAAALWLRHRLRPEKPEEEGGA